jgi:hypothetical protein
LSARLSILFMPRVPRPPLAKARFAPLRPLRYEGVSVAVSNIYLQELILFFIKLESLLFFDNAAIFPKFKEISESPLKCEIFIKSMHNHIMILILNYSIQLALGTLPSVLHPLVSTRITEILPKHLFFQLHLHYKFPTIRLTDHTLNL